MKNNHHLLRTMKKELRKEEADEPPPTQAEQLYSRLEISMRKLSHSANARKPYTAPAREPEIKVSLLNPAAAQQLTRTQLWNHWLHARGQESGNSEKDIRTTAERLYETVETAEGEAQADQLLWLLVALGVGIKQEVLVAMLGREGRVKKEDWVEFCVDKTGVFKALERMKSPEDMPSSVISSTSFDLSHGQLLVSNLHSHFRRLLPIHDQLLQVWDSLDPQGSDSVQPERVAETLVRLGCVVTLRSARAMMEKVLGHQILIQRGEFLALFNKGLLHLHIAALARLLPTSAHDFLLCTRFIIMSSLSPQATDTAIIQRLEQLQPPTNYTSYEEYTKAMAQLLLPAGYTKPKARPASLPRPIPTIQVYETIRPPEVPIVVVETRTPATLLAKLPVLSREEAEELQRSDPLALEGKIVVSEVRPMSDKASLRSTVTDLRLDKREKRYSLQEHLLSESEETKTVPPAPKPPCSRPVSMARGRRNYSRGSTAPSFSVPARRSTASSMRTSPPLPSKLAGRTLNSEFDRMVEFVPDVSVGLFM
jgi:hypothetical protein